MLLKPAFYTNKSSRSLVHNIHTCSTNIIEKIKTNKIFNSDTYRVIGGIFYDNRGIIGISAKCKTITYQTSS